MSAVHAIAWWERAACRGMTDEETEVVFFNADRRSSVALTFCRRCPVTSACLADALAGERGTRGVLYGVRGGLLPGERRRLIDAEGAPSAT